MGTDVIHMEITNMVINILSDPELGCGSKGVLCFSKTFPNKKKRIGISCMNQQLLLICSSVEPQLFFLMQISRNMLLKVSNIRRKLLMSSLLKHSFVEFSQYNISH